MEIALTALIVFKKELLEILRDRRTMLLLFSPPLIMPLFALLAAGLIMSQVAQQTSAGIPVAVVNAQAAPELVALLRESPELRLVELPADPDAALRDGRLMAVLTLPADFTARVAAGEQVRVALRSSEGYWLSSLGRTALESAVARYSGDLLAQRLAEHGLDFESLQPVVIAQEAVAPSGLSVVAGAESGAAGRTTSPMTAVFFPLAIATWAITGGLGLIVESTIGEKVNGTMSLLLVSVSNRVGVALGKLGMAVVISGAVMGVWLLEGLVLFALVDLAPGAAEALASGAGLSLGAEMAALGSGALVLVVLLVPFIIALTAWVMVLCTVARNYRESNLFLFVLELGFPMVALYAAFGVGPQAGAGYYLAPLLGTILAVRDLFQGGLAPAHLALTVAASLAYAAAGLAVAGAVFSRELALAKAD